MTAPVQSVLPVVSVWDVHGFLPLADAWADWSGFVLLHPGEQSRTPLPFVATRDMEAVEWFRSNYEQTSLVHPLGCHFIRDLQITGQGYAFSEDRLLQQDTYLSRIALQELTANPSFTPAGSVHRQQRVIEEPVPGDYRPG